MAGYSGTPLPKKLGIKEGSTIGLFNPPEDFQDVLGDLPDGVVIRRRARGPLDVIVSFHTRRSDLEKRLPLLARAVDVDGAIWFAWPKRASGVPTDITEDTLREICLPLGLVDNKVCAIDDIWSGLRLVWRKELRPSKRASTNR